MSTPVQFPNAVPGDGNVSLDNPPAQSHFTTVQLDESAPTMISATPEKALSPCVVAAVVDSGCATSFHFMNALESLQVIREQWEQNELAASHAKLYLILAECYVYYLKMKSPAVPVSVRKQMAAGLDNFCNSRGLRTLAETHDMNRVVKAVFGSDRRRVSSYALALRAALTGKTDASGRPCPVEAEDLADWIAANGGVEELRLGKPKATGIPTADRIAIATHAVQQKPLMSFKPDAKTMPFGTDDADKVRVLVVTYRPTGILEVNAVVKSGGVVNAALEAHYMANKESLGTALPGAAAAPASAVVSAVAAAQQP